MNIEPPFGRMLTAMITPFTKEGAIDWGGLEKIAEHLISNGNDGIVVNGTTGEAPTTSDPEKMDIVRAVKSVVGNRGYVLSGAGNNETSHSIEQAKMMAEAGADGLMVVTPYYNKPPQAGVMAHFIGMAEASDLNVVIYDIPGRTGLEIETDTICKLAEHPKIVALKDAKGRPADTSIVIKRTGLPVYSGDDILNLPLLSVGAIGFVSVCGHTVGNRLKAMLNLWLAGDSQGALAIHQELLPIFVGTFRTQGAIMTKAALTLMGLPGGYTRLPLVDATPAQIEQLKKDLQEGGLQL